MNIDTWRINGGDTYVKFDPITNRSALRNATLVRIDPPLTTVRSACSYPPSRPPCLAPAPPAQPGRVMLGRCQERNPRVWWPRAAHQGPCGKV